MVQMCIPSFWYSLLLGERQIILFVALRWEVFFHMTLPFHTTLSSSIKIPCACNKILVPVCRQNSKGEVFRANNKCLCECTGRFVSIEDCPSPPPLPEPRLRCEAKLADPDVACSREIDLTPCCIKGADQLCIATN